MDSVRASARASARVSARACAEHATYPVLIGSQVPSLQGAPFSSPPITNPPANAIAFTNGIKATC